MALSLSFPSLSPFFFSFLFLKISLGWVSFLALVSPRPKESNTVWSGPF